MSSLADAIQHDMLMSDAKRGEAQSMLIFTQEAIVKDEINSSVWRFVALEFMTAGRAVCEKVDTSIARAQLASMPVVLRQGNMPLSQYHTIFGRHVTRQKICNLRSLLQQMVEDTAKYQNWENDIQALLLDLEKIDQSF